MISFDHTWITNPKDPLSAVVASFLSIDHREERMDGCPIVALGSDAARQGSDVKASFEAGIREYLELLDRWVGEADGEQPSGKAMAILSTMVGAVLTIANVKPWKNVASHVCSTDAETCDAAERDQKSRVTRNSNPCNDVTL